MVDRYLYNGKMYVLDDDGVKCECVVTDEGNGILEIKNIATVPPFQRKGYAKALIEFLVEKYRGQFSILQVGTGDSPLTIPFYEKCGFVRSHTVPNFFTDHYDHPIYEQSADKILSDLASRFINRKVFKSITFDEKDLSNLEKLRKIVKDLGFDPTYYTALHLNFDLPYDVYKPDVQNPRTQIEMLQEDAPLPSCLHYHLSFIPYLVLRMAIVASTFPRRCLSKMVFLSKLKKSFLTISKISIFTISESEV